MGADDRSGLHGPTSSEGVRPSVVTSTKRRLPDRRTYVLDTSVLLADPNAISRFDEHEVVLPIVVITELEAKRHHPELGYFARQALRLLDDFRVRYGRLDAPPSHWAIWAEPCASSSTTPTPVSCRPASGWGDNDSRILAVARNLQAEGYDVTVVSKDLPLRIKASSVGLLAEEYRAELAITDAGWTGMSELSLSGEQVDLLYSEERLYVPEAAELPVHTGLVLQSERGKALGRVTADGNVKLVRGDREAFGLHGRSAEQRIALDLLLDPEIGILSMGGRAGTGKSALALCAGLEAVLERRQHQKVMVFRPLYAVGGQDLGYLPGDASEKMSPSGAGGLRHPLGRGRARGHRGGAEPGDAGGPAAHAHPGPVAARRVRDRGRGAVAGAERPSDRSVQNRREFAGGSHP
ncbi:hypothetical protein GCM10020254_33840 [Streptomyces goshikiensis]